MFNNLFDRDLRPYATEARWYRFKMPTMLDGGQPRIKGDFPVLEEVHNDQLPTETVKGPLMVVANNSDVSLEIANFVLLEIRYIPDMTDLKDPTFDSGFVFGPVINPGDIYVRCVDGSVYSTFTGWNSPFGGNDWYMYLYGVTLNRDFDPTEF